jgi:hypothetical protein
LHSEGKEKRGIEESLAFKDSESSINHLFYRFLLRSLDQVGKSKADSFQSPVVMLD